MKNEIQPVILAAGSGERFAKVGYTEPKPLIPILGEPMINYPLRLAKYVNILATVISTPAILNLISTPCRTVRVEYPQRGPALSLLCLNGHVPDSAPVLVMACDDRIDHIAFDAFIAAFRELCAGMDNALVMTTQLQEQREATAAYAYVHGANEHVSFIYEKKPSLLPARIFCGVIGFRRWDIARLAIMRMVCRSEDSVNGEYFVAPAANHISAVRYFDIPRSAFVTVGTPEALHKFEEEHSRVQNKG